MTNLHAQYAPTLIQLAQDATTNGEPINRPIWWLDPTDSTALGIDDGKIYSIVLKKVRN